VTAQALTGILAPAPLPVSRLTRRPRGRPHWLPSTHRRHRMIVRSAAAIATALLLACAAVPVVLAHDYEAGPLTVIHPWARASAGAAKTGAVYFSIRNNGDASERLLGASVANAGSAELHTHVTE